jgi:CRP/FNR family transcriptional regulator, cyclic AMP receptor protein
VSDQIETVEFLPGDILFLEGEKSFHFYIVQVGEVEIYKSTATGKKIPLAVVEEGTAIGEFAMIDRMPRSATAIALTQVVAVKVSEQAYEKLLGELPVWAVSVMRSLVDRIRQTSDIIRKAGLIDPRVQEKIASTEFDSDTKIEFDDTPFLRGEAVPGEDEDELP